MPKKDDTTAHDDLVNDEEIDAKNQHEKKDNDTSHDWSSKEEDVKKDDNTDWLSLEQLKTKLVEQEEITKRAQSDYFRMKMEFDQYVSRADAAKNWYEVDGLMKALEKTLPFVNQLKTTLENIPEDIQGHAWVGWVQLLYTKMITDLELLWVKPIEVAIWTDPDYTIHIPIWMEEVEDEAMKNKISKEVEWGFVYSKWDIQKVVIPAKVMVGN